VVTPLRAPVVGGAPSLAQIQEALASKPFKLVTITQVDTSTGVLMDVEVRVCGWGGWWWGVT